jgi:hypothetical protein
MTISLDKLELNIYVPSCTLTTQRISLYNSAEDEFDFLEGHLARSAHRLSLQAVLFPH